MNEQPSKIYLLPNLMTAGNLFCGFTATLKILEGALLQSTNADAAADRFHEAIWFILGAFVFDFLDGRLARLGGHESSFGREFDSLADVVSFGVAPALLVYRIVLQEFRTACWIIALIYLACGALRLARFNTASANHERESTTNGGKNFTGFPIPAPPTLPFLHDVQPFPVPQFQGDQLENEKIHSAISGYFPRPHLYGDELRMDASCPVSRVSALRISAAVAVARMAARN